MAGWPWAAAAVGLLALPGCGEGREVAAGEQGLVPRCSEVAEVPPPVDGPRSVDEDVAEAQQWRAEMGLRSDEAWVRQVHAAPGESDEATAFEHPLTDEEVRELFGRNRGDEFHAVVDEYVAPYADTYSGGRVNHARGGIFEVAFISGVEAHRAALAERLGPDAQLDVITGEMAEKDALALQDRIWQEVQDRGRSASSSVDPIRGWVELRLDVVEPEIEQFLAERYPDIVCVEGPTPEELVPEGPQPQSGEGWRLLAELGGPPYFVRVALDDAAYGEIWRRMELREPRPAVDFAEEIVVHFGIATSGSCPDIRFEGVRVDEAEGSVRPVIVAPGPQPPMCTFDAVGHGYIVALARDDLPERFSVWPTAGACEWCEEQPGERADVDLARDEVDHGDPMYEPPW